MFVMLFSYAQFGLLDSGYRLERDAILSFTPYFKWIYIKFLSAFDQRRIDDGVDRTKYSREQSCAIF